MEVVYGLTIDTEFVTLNGVMAVMCIILPNSVPLGATYISVVEVRPILSAA